MYLLTQERPCPQGKSRRRSSRSGASASFRRWAGVDARSPLPGVADQSRCCRHCREGMRRRSSACWLGRCCDSTIPLRRRLRRKTGWLCVDPAGHPCIDLGRSRRSAAGHRCGHGHRRGAAFGPTGRLRHHALGDRAPGPGRPVAPRTRRRRMARRRLGAEGVALLPIEPAIAVDSARLPGRFHAARRPAHCRHRPPLGRTGRKRRSSDHRVRSRRPPAGD